MLERFVLLVTVLLQNLLLDSLSGGISMHITLFRRSCASVLFLILYVTCTPIYWNRPLKNRLLTQPWYNDTSNLWTDSSSENLAILFSRDFTQLSTNVNTFIILFPALLWRRYSNFLRRKLHTSCITPPYSLKAYIIQSPNAACKQTKARSQTGNLCLRWHKQELQRMVHVNKNVKRPGLFNIYCKPKTLRSSFRSRGS